MSVINAGIYRITVKPTGQFYIGKSLDLKKRFASHRSNLKRGFHSNEHLQRAVNEHGIGALAFDVMMICGDEAALAGVEDAHILKYINNDLCLNIALPDWFIEAESAEILSKAPYTTSLDGQMRYVQANWRYPHKTPSALSIKAAVMALKEKQKTAALKMERVRYWGVMFSECTDFSYEGIKQYANDNAFKIDSDDLLALSEYKTTVADMELEAMTTPVEDAA